MSRFALTAERLVAYVHIPRLPIQAELARRPTLARHPVVIAAPAHARPVVADCSPVAERSGLHPGMPLREVLSTCREAVTLPPDPHHYQVIHDAWLDALENVVPAVEEAGLGSAYADLSGMEGLYPNLADLFKALLNAAPKGLQAGVAAGPNKFVAALAARAATGAEPVRISAEAAASFLSTQPVHYLPVSEEMQRRLSLLGLHTLGQLAQMQPEALVAQFGREGWRAWEMARGIDRTPFRPRRPFRPISESLVFPAPSAEWEVFWAGARQLLGRVWHRKERSSRTVRQLHLLARIEGDQSWEKIITLPEPVGELERLTAIVHRRLAGAALPGAVEALTLRLTVLGGPYVGQGHLFGGGAERWQKLAEAALPFADAIRSRRPTPHRGGGTVVSDPGAPLRADRLRTLNNPRSISVEADRCGTPQAIRRAGKRRRVAAVLDQWRVDDEWWRQPLSRRYFLIELADGTIRTVFCDLQDGAWYEQCDSDAPYPAD